MKIDTSSAITLEKQPTSDITTTKPSNINGTDAPASDTQAPQANLNTSQSAKAILKNYDLHHISMSEVQNLGRELRDAGVLNDQQYMDFSTPWFGSINIKTGEVVDGNTKIDYPAAFQNTITFLKNNDPDSTQTIHLMEKMQTMFLNLNELQSN